MNRTDDTVAAAAAPEPARLLEERGVRPTPNRVLVTRALMQSRRPATLAELETCIDTMDRSALFRALTLLAAKEVLHVIDDGCGSTRYELCHGHGRCTPRDMHAHFHCERCGRTVCLPDVPVPLLPLPEGYSARSVNYMIKGLCPGCSLAPE